LSELAAQIVILTTFLFLVSEPDRTEETFQYSLKPLIKYCHWYSGEKR